MGTVRASELIRSLQRGGRASTLGRAIGELGRIPKTLHLLNFIADSNYRRHILNQLNRGEGRGRLAWRVFYDQRGELRQRYREGQENQLSALGLVVNALILWTTRYMDAALNHLRATGADVKKEDLARLSPLSHELRPLRMPEEADEELQFARATFRSIATGGPLSSTQTTDGRSSISSIAVRESSLHHSLSPALCCVNSSP